MQVEVDRSKRTGPEGLIERRGREFDIETNDLGTHSRSHVMIYNDEDLIFCNYMNERYCPGRGEEYDEDFLEKIFNIALEEHFEKFDISEGILYNGPDIGDL